MARKATARRDICPGCWRDDIAIIGNGVMARHLGIPGGVVCPSSGQSWRALTAEENAERKATRTTIEPGTSATPGGRTPIGAASMVGMLPRRWR